MNLFGYVGGDEFNETAVSAEIKKLIEASDEIEVTINSGGGSVYSGIAIYNLLNACEKPVNVIVAGLAASMASIIMLAGDTVKMYSNAKVMIHAPSIFVAGQVADLESAKEQLEDWRKTMTSIYAERTGKPQEEVAKWLVDGKDTWFNAEQALDAQLVDEIIKTEKPRPKANNEQKLVAFYSEALANVQTPVHTNMNKVLMFLGLAADAGEEQILAALKDKQKENTDLKAANADLKAKQLEDLLANAVKEGRITDEQKAHYKTVLEASFDAGKKLLESMPAKNPEGVKGMDKDRLAKLKAEVETQLSALGVKDETGKGKDAEPKAVSIAQRIAEAQQKKNS